MFGAGGRMGATVCAAVVGDPELELVAAVDPYHADIDLQQLGVPDTGLHVSRTADALTEAGAEVAVDFTVVDAARGNLDWCADNGVHAVVGTTGFTVDDVDRLTARFAKSDANAVIAPNFAIGAILMMRFAELAAPYFDTGGDHRAPPRPEDRRPVGYRHAHRAADGDASPSWALDPTDKFVLEGRAGARGRAGSGSTRSACSGLVAHQEVLLGTTGQS